MQNEESREAKLVNQFCIPKFCNSENLVIDEDDSTLSESNINIMSLNFSILQREYVSKSSDLY